jgi:hypothetical protein
VAIIGEISKPLISRQVSTRWLLFPTTWLASRDRQRRWLRSPSATLSFIMDVVSNTRRDLQ